MNMSKGYIKVLVLSFILNSFLHAYAETPNTANVIPIERASSPETKRKKRVADVKKSLGITDCAKFLDFSLHTLTRDFIEFDDSTFGAASSALSRVTTAAKSSLRLTEEPVLVDEVPRVFVDGYRLSARGDKILSILTSQDAYNYLGKPLKDSWGDEYEGGLRIWAYAEIFSKEAIYASYASPNLRARNPERHYIELTTNLIDTSLEALNRSSVAIKGRLRLTEHPSFHLGLPRLFISGFTRDRNGEPIMSMYAHHVAYDSNGRALKSSTDLTFSKGMEVIISFDVHGQNPEPQKIRILSPY